MNNTEKPKKKKSGCLVVAIVVFVLIGIIGAAGSGSSENESENPPKQPEQIEQSADIPSAGQENSDDVKISDETEPEELQSTKYKEGQYKIGADMPAGAYVLIQDYFDWTSYFAITSDANGKDILKNDNFDGHSIVEVVEGEFLEISRCYAVPLEESVGFASVDGYLSDGAYIVGKHIPAGEYKVEATEDFAAYICIYPDLRRSKISSNDNFDGSRYVSLEDGQLFEIKRGRIFVGE